MAVSISPSQPLHQAGTATACPDGCLGEAATVTGTSVLVIVPWAVFATGLIALCLRLRRFRR